MMHELCYFSDDPYTQDTVSQGGYSDSAAVTAVTVTVEIRKIPFYCIFGMICLLTLLTIHIFTLNCVSIVLGDHICDLVRGVGKNDRRDLFYG